MERFPSPADELKKHIGKIVTEEMLFGRGYVLVNDGEVIEDKFPRLKDFEYEDDELNEEANVAEAELLEEEDDDYSDDDDSITCKGVKKYIASQIENYVYDDDEKWIKGIPANPCDVNNQEVYQVIVISTKPVENGYKITDVCCLARMVEQIGGGWFSIPGAASMESHFFEMELVPPEPLLEVENLVKGRFIPKGFSLIGKSMPDNKEEFHPNPPYSIAKNSGWRNVYYHLSIDVNDDEIIESVELSTYERETSMFQRPYCMDDDPADAFDCTLLICDQYTDDEWGQIINKQKKL